MRNLVDVGDSRRFVDLQLALSLPQQVLYGAKVLLVQVQVLVELFPMKYQHGCMYEIRPRYLANVSKCGLVFYML